MLVLLIISNIFFLYLAIIQIIRKNLIATMLDITLFLFSLVHTFVMYFNGFNWWLITYPILMLFNIVYYMGYNINELNIFYKKDEQ